jgi:hypothetical protein
MKIRTVVTVLFHADRWTDLKKLLVAFCNFTNEPKNVRLGIVGNIWYFDDECMNSYLRPCAPKNVVRLSYPSKISRHFISEIGISLSFTCSIYKGLISVFLCVGNCAKIQRISRMCY